jgi:heat shock protein HspQ
MPSRVFSIDDLEELEVAWCNDFKESRGKRRWMEAFDVVFRADDDEKLYHVVIEEGNTEYQECYGEDRYPERDYRNKTVECPEVELYETMRPVTVFRKVKDNG